MLESRWLPRRLDESFVRSECAEEAAPLSWHAFGQHGRCDGFGTGQSNGDLLRLAEAAGFNVFVTADQELSYQQNLAARKIAIVELTKNNWPPVKPRVEEIAAAVDSCVAGSYVRVICGR